LISNPKFNPQKKKRKTNEKQTKKHSLNQKRAFGSSSARAAAWAVLFFCLTSLLGLVAFGADYVNKVSCLSSRIRQAEKEEATTAGAADAE
jgi:branched-subunit amino acid permease